jgi:2-polyprenyl-3-methyl-5-hydroxy-6-metoxy-1,4-benzoquinol methylase
MLPAAVQSWFKRTPSLSSARANNALPSDGRASGSAEADQANEQIGPRNAGPPNPWPPDRLAVTNRLWGDGFTLPGGEIETMRLAHPLGLSSAASLLLVGVGGGGPASCIARNLGAWVTGLEVEPALVEQAHALIKSAALGKKATVETWNPHNPDFPARRYHHCLAIEPLRCGGEAAQILDSLAQTLKIGGQLVMTELVAEAQLLSDDRQVTRWAALETRSLSAIQSPNAIRRMLARVGFDVRVAEDVSDRHIENALIGWRVAVRELRRSKPPPLLAAHLVAEAEIWLLRVKLLRQQRLRMMRWHAINTAAART